MRLDDPIAWLLGLATQAVQWLGPLGVGMVAIAFAILFANRRRKRRSVSATKRGRR